MHAVGARIGEWIVDDAVVLTEPWVYKAHHRDDPARIASLEVAVRGRHDEALERRAAALRVLDHPAIPRCLDQGATTELAWIATDWVEAEALSDCLLEGPLEWREACALFLGLASALAHVHAAGLAHRDLTPAHVRIGADGAARLGGFGLSARAADVAAGGLPHGDLAYVAPEVLAQPDHPASRADLYALGCVLYEALTGRRAFPAAAWGGQGSPEAEMLDWKTRAEPLDPGDVAPPWLAQLVRKATHPDPSKRLPDVEAFVAWLEGARPSWASRSAAPAPVVPLPALAPIVLAPSLQLRVARAPEPPPEAPEVDTTTPSGSFPRAALPPAARYAKAAALGALSGLVFSALVIAFARVSAGG